MEIAISLKENQGLDSEVSPIFGRCPFFMFIDPDSKEFTVEPNTAMLESGGAGIMAAQMMVNKKVTAVISGDFGPKASSVLFAEGIALYQHQGRIARETVDAFEKQELKNLFSPTANAHSGLK